MAQLDKFFTDREVPTTPSDEPAAVVPGDGGTAVTPPPASAPPAGVTTPPIVSSEPTPSFDINTINKFFGTSLKEEAELREALKHAGEYGTMTQKYQELESKYKALEEKAKETPSLADPLSYFSSPEAYVAEQIRKQRPDVDPSVVSKLLSHEKSRLADFDLLVNDTLMNTPNIIGGIDGARELIAKRYGIDLDQSPEEWDRTSRNMMMTDARGAEQRISQLKSEIKVPTVRSQEEIAAMHSAEVQKVKASWAPYVNELAGYDKLVVPGNEGSTLLEMEIPKEFRDSLPDMINNVIEQTGITPSPETIADMVDHRNRKFVYDYLPKILEVYGNNVRSELEKKYAGILNNTVPPNTAAAPPASDGSQGGGARQLLGGTRRSGIR